MRLHVAMEDRRARIFRGIGPAGSALRARAKASAWVKEPEGSAHNYECMHFLPVLYIDTSFFFCQRSETREIEIVYRKPLSLVIQDSAWIIL